MSILETQLGSANVKIETLTDFDTMTFIMGAASTELEDGRKVEIFVGATNPFYFEIKIEGEDRMLRLSLKDLMSDAVKLLDKETS